MNFTQKILFCLISIGFVTTCCVPKSVSQKLTRKPSDAFPEWIEKEKIRAGYLYAYNDARKASLISTHGLNALIVKGWQFYKKSEFDKTLNNYRKWGRAGKKEKLHIFIAYNWQPQPQEFSYRTVVCSDGTLGVGPCPRDYNFWNKHVTHLGKVIAQLSLEPNLQIDGIYLDCELYRSEGMKREKRVYGTHNCFCDNCFSSFLLAKGYTGQQLPTVERSDREKWLKKNNLLQDYFAYLEREVESLAKNFEQEFHKINPSLIIGMYPTPHDWVLKSLARAFGTEDLPVLLFATHSYYKGGHKAIPRNPKEFYKGSGINAFYAAGFLFGRYGSDELEINLYNAAKKCDGYWVYRMPLLWLTPAKGFKLADGSPQEYWQSLKNANNKIERFYWKE